MHGKRVEQRGQAEDQQDIDDIGSDGGANGDVKDYTVQLSLDGKNWGEPVARGKFDKGKAEKKVLFDKPVKARYIRFTALSEQRGQDFATGAEMTILAE